MSLSNIIAEIADERLRQVQEEGWSPEHDDEHAGGEMADAAACYAASSVSLKREVVFRGERMGVWRNVWPFAHSWWKPKSRRRDLVRAAALIVAEIERIDRASAERVADGVA